MGTDRLRGFTLFTAGFLTFGGSNGLWAQSSLYLVNRETTISSVEFKVRKGSLLDELPLQRRVSARGPGALTGLRRALDWLPLVSAGEPMAFDPVALQKDVARLRGYYRESGFPEASVDYRLSFDTESNSVDIVFEIAPGQPRILGHVRLVVSSETDSVLLDEEGLNGVLNNGRGRRLGEQELQVIVEEARVWITQRGYPFPEVEARPEPRPGSMVADVVVVVDPGPRATVGTIRVEGTDRLDRPTVLDQILFRPGDMYSSQRVDESAQQLLALRLVNLALIEPQPVLPGDSVTDIDIQIVEGALRVISGRTGFEDATGVLTELAWEHRNFFGKARTLRAAVQAETGIWAFESFPRKLFGASLSLEHPHLFGPRTEWLSTAFGEYVDGPLEEARSVGGDFTVLFQHGPQRFLSLRYGLFVKDVLEFRGGGIGPLGILDAIRRLETLEETAFQSTVTISGSWGDLNDVARPTQGWTLRGALEVGGADPWSDSQYVRADASGLILRELKPRGLRILLRGRAGRLLPFGRSGTEADPFLAYLRFGEAVFTEGGTHGLRGWEDGLAGPVIPDLRFDLASDSLAIVARDRYVPLGGLARWGGSMEFQLPASLLGLDGYGLIFLDGGRVWTPDKEFLGEDGFPLLGEETQTRFGTGAGVAVQTFLGDIRVMVGYKLNPGALELLSPKSVGRALIDGFPPVEDLDKSPWRRWRLHLSVGQVF